MSQGLEAGLADEINGRAPVRHRPVQILVSALGGFEATAFRQRDHWPGLRVFVNSLNASQALFEFKCNDVALKLEIGDEELLHGYTAEQFYERLAGQLASSAEIDCAIGLTHTPLENGEFNHHDQQRGVGVITIESYQQYIPETGSLKRYLAYLIFCEAFCLAGRQQYEHEEHRKCLFDLCREKPELEDCLREPRICGECQKKLLESGFGKDETRSVENALQRLAKPAFGSALSGAMKRPMVNMVAGACVAVAAATYSATEDGTLAWLPVIVLTLFVVLFVIGEYLSAKVSRWVITHPRGRFLTTLLKPYRWASAKVRP